MRLFITILIVLLSVSNVYSQAECKFTTKDNKVMDLSFLNNTGNPYTYKSGETNMEFIYNICGIAPYCANAPNGDKFSSICAVNSTVNPPSIISFGDSSNGEFRNLPDGVEGEGAQLFYGGNPSKKCGNSGTRNSYINLICSNVNKPQVVSIIEPWNNGVACQLTVTIKVPCTKPTGGLGGGWIFIIILFSGTVAYIIFGSVINWKFRDQHGANIFPNIEFWRSFGSHIKDGCGYIKSKVTGTSGQNYQTI